MAKLKIRPARVPEPVEVPIERMAGLAARAEAAGERYGPFWGQLKVRAPDKNARSRAVPVQWTVEHVLDRFEEAYRTLGNLPLATRPRAYANSMPTYVYERSDLVHQVETYELQRLMSQRNRVRIAPSPGELERMAQALAWPMQYLGDKPEVARAVGLGAFWTVRRASIEQQCRSRGMSRRTFIRRKVHGLKIIAMALIRARVLVS